MKQLYAIFFSVFACLTTPDAPAQAQTATGIGQNELANVKTPRYDVLFPGSGKLHAGLIFTYSGVTPPPALIGDVTIGISRRFSAGITGGTTGALALYGIKANWALWEEDRWRFVFRMTSVYYPERSGRFLFDRRERQVMPRMLSMAVIDWEWKSAAGIRWAIGAGFIETHCAAGMEAWFKKVVYRRPMARDVFFFETFSAVQASVSLPVSRRLCVRPEVFAVFKDGNLIGRDKYKITFPVNPYIYLVYKL